MNPEDRKHIEAIRHALNKALGQARVAVDDAPHWAKDVVWLLNLVERQEAELRVADWGQVLGAALICLTEIRLGRATGDEVRHQLEFIRDHSEDARAAS